MIDVSKLDGDMWRIAKQTSNNVFMDNRPIVMTSLSDYIVISMGNKIDITDFGNNSINEVSILFELSAKDIDDKGTKNSKRLGEMENSLITNIDNATTNGYYFRYRGTIGVPYFKDGFHSIVVRYSITISN